MCDFERLQYEVKPCDVILVEGRSRVSEVIKQITQSPWSHAALYIGKLHDIDDPEMRAQVEQFYDGDPYKQLVIESYLGEGTIVSPLENYHKDHLRICRPKGISIRDARHVIGYAIDHLGVDYDVRQILDLARFLLPWSIMPRRWRSTLFDKDAGSEIKVICSTIIAEAFKAVRFPILPVLQMKDHTQIELVPRNPRLMTPKDFDYSPYFEIIKYPFIGIDSVKQHHDAQYKILPWAEEGVHNGGDGNFCPVNFDQPPKRILPRPIKKSADINVKQPESPSSEVVKDSPEMDAVEEVIEKESEEK